MILTLSLLAVPLTTEAQPAGKVPRIGVMGLFFWPPFDTFRAGLRELGYVEGENIIVEYRWSEGENERFQAFVAEFIRSNVDVIVVWGTPAALAAKQATSTIPIVMAATGDPIGNALVASLQQPGGNITGSSALNAALEAKRLELLKELIPTLSRVAVLWNPALRLHQVLLQETQATARVLGLQLFPVEAVETHTAEYERAFAAMLSAGAEALIVAPGFILDRAQIADLALKNRLPAAYVHRDHCEAGGLLCYAANYHALFRRAATYVDKILKGAKPRDLPVEQPMKFDLIINLKTAKALGITMPPALLLLADEVIQ
jgi:putative ABC transport system substrate-binding protein